MRIIFRSLKDKERVFNKDEKNTSVLNTNRILLYPPYLDTYMKECDSQSLELSKDFCNALENRLEDSFVLYTTLSKGSPNFEVLLLRKNPQGVDVVAKGKRAITYIEGLGKTRYVEGSNVKEFEKFNGMVFPNSTEAARAFLGAIVEDNLIYDYNLFISDF